MDLERIYNLDQRGKFCACLDEIFNYFDDNFLDGKFQECDDMLLKIDVNRLSEHTLVGILSITKSAEDKLNNRETIRNMISRRLELIIPGRVDAMMSGL